MSKLSHTIRKFNCFELKYLVPIKAAEEFKQGLRAYLVPDDHGDSLGCYYLSSLYYDGPHFCFYWERVDGIKFRRKLRVRYYESTEPLTADMPVFMEIKQRLNRITQKWRVSLPYGQALRLCNERQMPEARLFAPVSLDATVLDEIAGMLWQYDLRLAGVVRYARQALVGTEYDIYHFRGAVPEEGTGSGFVYDAEGHIVTNYHVIENAQELLVTLANGQAYGAQVVGSDPNNDLAVIEIDAGEDLPSHWS